MTEEIIKEQAREIKRSFRLMMNGVASSSMRAKGVNYNINWGASLPMLKDKAKSIGCNYELAQELWKDNVRECKIIAILIMPHERMTPALAELWMEQTQTHEIAEMSAFYLFRHLDFAMPIALKWISSDKELHQYCGYNILTRLFSSNNIPSDSELESFLVSLSKALSSSSLSVKKAAITCSYRLADIEEDYENKVNNIINMSDK